MSMEHRRNPEACRQEAIRQTINANPSRQEGDTNETALSKIASVLGNGKNPRDQINQIAEILFESGEVEAPTSKPAASDYVWDDPMVVECCKEGRKPSDIRLMVCPACNKVSYWNEGSHFTCRFCHQIFNVSEEMASVSVSLADWGDDAYPITL